MATNLRVGFLTGSISRNGAGPSEVLRGLALAMHRPPEVELQIFGLQDANTAMDLPRWGSVPVTVSSVRGPKSFGYAPHLISAISDAAVNILHVHGLWMFNSIASRIWSRHTRAPYLVSPHGMLDRWALHHGKWKKRAGGLLYEFWHLRRAACLHALCEPELEAIRAFGLRNPVCVIPNGVEVVKPQPSRPAAWRAGIPEEAKVLLYFGRIHPKKGLPNLCQAWTALSLAEPRKLDNWHLVIAGWDEDGHRAQLEASLPRETGNRIRFIGPQFGADKEATLNSSDAFVLPSLSEGLPIAVLEAWAHSLPVLMTPNCNIPEGFSAGAALPIKPAPDDIARQLCVLFAMSDQQRHSIGRRGLQLVSTRFNWTSIAAQMAAVYLWIIGLGPRPDCARLVQPEPFGPRLSPASVAAWRDATAEW